jgi:hypothetical protein
LSTYRGYIMPRSGMSPIPVVAEFALALGSLLSASSAPVQAGSRAYIRQQAVTNSGGFVIGNLFDSTNSHLEHHLHHHLGHSQPHWPAQYWRDPCHPNRVFWPRYSHHRPVGDRRYRPNQRTGTRIYANLYIRALSGRCLSHYKAE